MRSIVLAYVVTAVVMVALDLTWLHLTSGPVYQRALGEVLAQKVDLPAAAAFYLVYIAGVVVFAVWPSIAGGEWTAAIVRGAMFGFFAYATYDLTNLATLKVWSLHVSLIDMAWGTFVTAVAGGAGAAAAALAGRPA